MISAVQKTLQGAYIMKASVGLSLVYFAIFCRISSTEAGNGMQKNLRAAINANTIEITDVHPEEHFIHVSWDLANENEDATKTRVSYFSFSNAFLFDCYVPLPDTSTLFSKNCSSEFEENPLTDCSPYNISISLQNSDGSDVEETSVLSYTLPDNNRNLHLECEVNDFGRENYTIDLSWVYLGDCIYNKVAFEAKMLWNATIVNGSKGEAEGLEDSVSYTSSLPYTEYNFTIHSTPLGNLSIDLFDQCTCVTPEEAPSEPVSLHSESTETTATLKWFTPFVVPGVVKFYEIQWQCPGMKSPQVDTANATGSSPEEYTIEGLSEDTICDAAIRAWTVEYGESAVGGFQTRAKDKTALITSLSILAVILVTGLIALCVKKSDDVKRIMTSLGKRNTTGNHDDVKISTDGSAMEEMMAT